MSAFTCRFRANGRTVYYAFIFLAAFAISVWLFMPSFRRTPKLPTPLCLQEARHWMDIPYNEAHLSRKTLSTPQQTDRLTEGDLNSDPVRQSIRRDWEKYVSSSAGLCLKALVRTNLYSQFFEHLYSYYSSHAGYCPYKRRHGRGGDGGKWICDTLNCGKCLVYSLGSHEEFDFEEDIQDYYGCEIHTFDCTSSGEKTPKGVQFHPWCISDEDHTPVNETDRLYYTIPTIMKKLNHSSIDVLKMDIERYEYVVVNSMKEMKKEQLPHQIAFEAHLNPMNGFSDYVTFEQYDALWRQLREMGYRVIAHDFNPGDQCCCDFTLIRSWRTQS